jgi:hypothetical protein
MKKILILTLFLALSLISRAQITLEYNYPASTGLTNLALSGYKYFLMDVVNNQCRIYNLDHSAWKTINLSVPAGMYLYDVRLVSETLFNGDSKVELAYIYYSYDTTLLYTTYYTRIIDENGLELLSIPGCAYLEVKSTGNTGTKMLAYVYDYSIILWTLNTHVYSLPGDLPIGGMTQGGTQMEDRPFPNPAGSSVTIPYHLPGTDTAGDIQLFDQSGRLLKQYRVDRTFSDLTIRLDELPAGAYFYRVTTGHGVINSGKIIHD